MLSLKSPFRAQEDGSGTPDTLGDTDRIKVVVRVRPPIPEDGNGHTLAAEVDFSGGVRVDSETRLPICRGDATYDDRNFEFDTVLDPKRNQDAMYSQVQHVVQDVMLGFNGTIMAYGQTGSGDEIGARACE